MLTHILTRGGREGYSPKTGAIVPGMTAGPCAGAGYSRCSLSGIHNARRDNLTRFWRNQFGHTHALMLAETFYENVDDGKGGSISPADIQRAMLKGESYLESGGRTILIDANAIESMIRSLK